MEGKTILVVDDEPYIRDLLKRILCRERYCVVEASNGEEALQRMRFAPPDLVVLDLMMPGMGGKATLQHIRTDYQMPVIVLSALTEINGKALCLDLGADDYLTKPFAGEELTARVRAVLRRAGENTLEEDAGFDNGPLNIDSTTRKVTRDGKELHLTRTEFDMLFEFASHAGKAIPYDEILATVWGVEYQGDRRRVHDCVTCLRKKIETDSEKQRYIVSLPAFGYRFNLGQYDFIR